MKFKWADNSEDFFESLQGVKDLVDVNCRKIEYVIFFCTKSLFLFSASIYMFRGDLVALKKALRVV